jgi:hypothetical protein
MFAAELQRFLSWSIFKYVRETWEEYESSSSDALTPLEFQNQYKSFLPVSGKKGALLLMETPLKTCTALRISLLAR